MDIIVGVFWFLVLGVVTTLVVGGLYNTLFGRGCSGRDFDWMRKTSYARRENHEWPPGGHNLTPNTTIFETRLVYDRRCRRCNPPRATKRGARAQTEPFNRVARTVTEV